jgi:tRNA A37 threonylcarbamoyladenosine synthetase subunit TsaC/SUA5/YrdC
LTIQLAYNPRVATLIEMHPTDPQPRRIASVVRIIRGGGLIAYPTDSSYAFGCHIGDSKAINRIHRIRQTDKRHNFTLVCRDLSEIGIYAHLDIWEYRQNKSITPVP